ncbi:hypothetical protein ABEB36_004825 [Hypothenemus hampei]|uniref:Cadherin domain-containing protein n=1 Tax=Hypothenemus hampei TaxID=57062 RepID=A0ABD1EVZ0_HYPHA
MEVSATDPDCGVNAVVNYTLGDGFEKLREFKVRPDSGEICISSSLDYETRNVYEFPVIATDRDGLSTTAMVKIQVTDVNDNRPIFYPTEYNVSLRDNGASPLSSTIPVIIVSATDADSGKFGTVSYRIITGNEAGSFRIDRNSGEIFLNRPQQLTTKSNHRLNITATDGGNLKSSRDAQVFISVIDSTQKPPIFDQSRYVFSVTENVKKDHIVGQVKAAIINNDRNEVRYSIYSGDPDGLFRIDPISGTIRVSGHLDHEFRASVLLNVQATSGNLPVYGHTQVNIDITDVNDNSPEFESTTVRISIPENTEIGVALYAAHATDKDGGRNGIVQYQLGSDSDLFKVDSNSGHLTLQRQLDYETVQRHTLIVTAMDSGSPPLSANLTILVEVQDMNDNPPVFEKAQYSLSVMESLPINSQIAQFTAVDADTGNNARITYRLLSSNRSNGSSDNNGNVFGIFPNSGWLYLNGTLDRETKDHYRLIVSAKDNGLPSQTATSQVTIEVLDVNDNDPVFLQKEYEFRVEENNDRGTPVGKIQAKDADFGMNAALRYSLVPMNGSDFEINPISGEISTKEILDRENKGYYDLVGEAKDQGRPSRSVRVSVKIYVLDTNDNAPEIVDPQEDVVSVREEQNPGTEVVRIRAIDVDNGYNSSITFSLLKDSDGGSDTFTIHPITGIVRTKLVLDHEEKTIYRLGVVATDGGNPPKQSVRMLRVEVLDLNDNRPTFTSSSLTFSVREDAKIGQIIGTVASAPSDDQENIILDSTANRITYTLTSSPSQNAFDIERNTGKIVLAQELDREKQSEYKLEIRALDVRALNNPQSSAITVKIDVTDVNDNAPYWPKDPVIITLSENTLIGSVVYNFTAIDLDIRENGEVRYGLSSQYPNLTYFHIDILTGLLTLVAPLDYETYTEHLLIVEAKDQPLNVSETLTSYLTVRVHVTDFNDNIPKFVLPQSSTIFLQEGATVGMTIANILALDADSDDNGRVTYIMSSTNNDVSYFSLGYDNGALTLTKPPNGKIFNLNITATDLGKAVTKQASLKLKITVQDSLTSSENNRMLENELEVNVMENAGVGTLVTQILLRGVTPSGQNVTFYIPPGITDDTFEIHSSSGKVFTKKPLDREIIESYILPIYVTEFEQEVPMFDRMTLHVRITDINDHAPKFESDSCQRLTIPENSETAVFHTVVANDLDQGANSEISYSITSGNIRNKFSIDAQTGQITAKPLDRESNSRYYLTITAQDHGIPSRQGSCNLTIFIEDQNDNDPKFDLSKYSTNIYEDVPIDTSILKVHASDADIGLNSKIIYFLANESEWLFRIDNKTGVITTAGLFDRERKSEYNFMVVATDSGKYNARSTKVPVTVYVKDVNDNKPIFVKYPFREKVPSYLQAGQNILKVQARDLDEDTNSEIVYSLINNEQRFRINPNSGVLTATQSLSNHNGKIIYLSVIASDKGNPPQSSTGLIELIVGNLPDSSLNLRFQNQTYEITLSENSKQLTEMVQVNAVRTDGRRQKILYDFGTGNEDNAFAIDEESGVIQVKDSTRLDYEKNRQLHLVVEAKTEGNPVLRGYCEVVVRLTDENDNAPKFTQQQYTASVWEGDKKGTFILQTIASDADEGQNSRILYHIVDGNHDNAFKIEPAFSGIVKTNTVLDREIRDSYRLTIIATDEGIPQMTGTARVRINVLDVNDNQPTFPPPKVVHVSENTEIGSLVAVLTANDVDTYPEITYSFAADVDSEQYLEYFSIDRYSGKIFLKKQLDFEQWEECKLKIVASDMAHKAETILTIEIVDVNDNAPIFSQSFYETNLPEDLTVSEVLILNATDADSEENSNLTFSILSPIPGFWIGQSDGILRLNTTKPFTNSQDIYLTIKVQDSGRPPLASTVSVRIKNGKRIESGFGYKKEYQIHVNENTLPGSSLLHLPKSTGGNYIIVDGDFEKSFQISSSSGALLLVKPLDREKHDEYNLKISMGGSSTRVQIIVEDANDNAPIFSEAEYKKTVKESAVIGSLVQKISAVDADLSGNKNSEIYYEITSGNPLGCFRIDPESGEVFVNKTLDYDRGIVQYHLVVKACDQGSKQLCALTSLHITLEDDNDNIPIFPFSEYMESVGENEPLGTAVFTARATDLDKGIYGKINYSLIEDSYLKLFHIDNGSGLVTTATIFDYEQRNRYSFSIKAIDMGGQCATIKVYVEIEGKDEYYPQFTERTYKFPLATSASLPAGYVLGHVLATDKDKGPDGRVVYQLNTQHPYFKINRTTGALLLKKKLDYELESKEISLIVTASSGRQGSLTNMTVIEILLDPLGDPGTNLPINGGTIPAPNEGMSDWALGLVISIALLLIIFGSILVYLHMRHKRNRKLNKPNLSQDAVSTSNNYVDPSAFDTIPIRGGATGQIPQGNQFAPPKYDEIHHPTSSNSGAATTSELSGSEQSGSSGRGSAEDGDDGEDEEIRMINENSRGNDGDSLSAVSVRNTQEYLARLGIVTDNSSGSGRIGGGGAKESSLTHHHQTVGPLDIFDEETANDNDIHNLIYAKLNDDRASVTDDPSAVQPPTMEHVMAISYGEGPTVVAHHQPSMNGSLSSIVHSEEELAGSYNWDYLLDWGPQYQPLAHVFSEIARLKDDTASVHSGASGNSSVRSKISIAPKKMPPPMISGVAPRVAARTAHNQIMMLPRSPINHDATGASFSSSAAMSPSFSPSLSPLATKSPSISPLGLGGGTPGHHVISRQNAAQNRNSNKSVVDAELRI